MIGRFTDGNVEGFSVFFEVPEAIA